MRLAVLDVGSNTVHLLVVDAHRGAAPLPAYSQKEALRLAEHLVDGAMTEQGVTALVGFVRQALVAAEDKGCESVLAFATSAVRDATNGDDVLRRVNDATGVNLLVLPGGDEARLTFLAVRRWFGWSAGRVTVFDIGGGSLEIAAGADESPEVAQSLPLGAGRLTREWLSGGAPGEDDLKSLRKHIRTAIAHDAGDVLRGGRPDHHVATSKTFRSLSRICGAAPAAEGPFVRRSLPHDQLQEWIPKLAAMSSEERATLPGVSPARAHQLVAGALVADAVMDLFEVDELEVCPWALREGVILEHLDKL
ncbi:MAG: Ppx/GppA family phosphatase [Propionibacteriales bacterium]|nr:Ppx/GppA family phosphatase [Propionibacteriales bacterium]